jgi:hypothetical protein
MHNLCLPYIDYSIYETSSSSYVPLKGPYLVLVIKWQLRWTNCVLYEIHRWLVHRYMCVSNICHGGGNGLEMLQSLHMWWWRSLLHVIHDIESCDQGGDNMRLGSMDRLQVWRASQRLWNEGPCVTVKLEQNLVPMDQRNGEEQVRSRSMNQYGHVMIWSGSYHLVIGWCMCCINTKGDGIEMCKAKV